MEEEDGVRTRLEDAGCTERKSAGVTLASVVKEKDEQLCENALGRKSKRTGLKFPWVESCDWTHHQRAAFSQFTVY